MDFEQKMQSLIFGFILSGLVLAFARLKGFFIMTKRSSLTIVSASQVLGAFFAFLSVPLIVVPILFAIGLWIFHGERVTTIDVDLSPILRGWLNLTVILGTVGAMALYSLLNFSVVHRMFNPDNKGFEWGLKQFGMGILACLTAMPLVFTFSQLLDWWIEWQFNISPVEQTAVVHLQSVTESPTLFYISLISVATVVPVVEELLFRGFLQTWLMNKIGVPKGIVLTAFIFALFHYANQQSWFNLQIVPTLFILALFLGYIYARQQSLWASIGLHTLFNLVGISAIFFESSH